MVTTVRAHIRGGAVIPDTPIDLPDGLQVQLQITTSENADSEDLSSTEAADIDSVFGMWRDREEMSDSGQWVTKQRQAWQTRPNSDRD